MIVVAAAVALMVLTELVAPVARLSTAGPAAYRQAWGWAAGLTHHAMVPLLLVGTALAIVARTGRPVRRRSGCRW